MPDTQIPVIHVVAGLHPRSGGPSRTVVQLCDALAENPAMDITLLSQGVLTELSVPSASLKVTRKLAQSPSRLALKLGQPVKHELEAILKSRVPALIHSHGIWHAVNHWAASAARRHDIPLIIHTRGMLEPWAINYRVWKKRIAMTLFQRRDLEMADLFIATSEMEYKNIRLLGLPGPVAVIPNGLAKAGKFIEGDFAPAEKTQRTVLFLSRVHPKKGIINLLQAWDRVAPQGWCLKIAGPNENEHLSEVMATARRLGIATSIEYLGEVDGEEKASLYRGADLFVLPTFSENFGVVVAEALSHGLPVITTRGTPWSDLETYGCGWWIDIGVDSLADALRRAIGLSDAARQEMGARGRDYVQRYEWNDIAAKTVAVYLWLLGRGVKPDYVHLD